MPTEPWSTYFLDPALQVLITNCNYVALCSAKPINYTQAMSTYKLASVAISSSDFTGPEDGLVSGRRITLASKTGVSVTTTGVTNYLALVNSSATRLYYVKRTVQISVTSGGTVSIPSVVIEIRDPLL